MRECEAEMLKQDRPMFMLTVETNRHIAAHYTVLCTFEHFYDSLKTDCNPDRFSRDSSPW